MFLSRSSSTSRCAHRGGHLHLLAILIVAVAFVALSVQATNSQEADDASLVNILKQRIQSIQEYLEDPIKHLQQMSLGFDDDDADDDDDNTKSTYPNDIVEVLDSLEVQLNDSEMTRQFYSLGGWPLLTSLVSRNVHSNDNKLDISTMHLSEHELAIMEDKILYIRAQAAMTIGTAVKNTEDLRPWAATTVPLHLVVQALLEVSHVASEPSSCSKRTLEYQELLAYKALYALESFLHGNHEAQVAFSTMATMGDDRGDSPVEILGRQAAQWAQEAATVASTVSDNAPMSRHAIKMTTLLLSLVNDIVNEVQVQKLGIIGQQHDYEGKKSIIDVLSADDWCQAAMRAATLSPSSDFKRLVFSPLQRTALQTVSTLGRHCIHYYQNDGQHLVAELTRLHEEHVEKMMENVANNNTTNLRSTTTTHTNESRDKERLQLIEVALDAIATTTTTATQ